MSARCADSLARQLSLDDLCVPAGRHRQPDPELRPAEPDRRPGRRHERRRQPRCTRTSLLQKLRSIPGAVDLRIQQAFDYPQLNVDVDRTKAQLLGLTQRDVASNLLVSLSGSFQTSALVLDRSEDRHAVQRRRADAAVQSRDAATISR